MRTRTGRALATAGLAAACPAAVTVVLRLSAHPVRAVRSHLADGDPFGSLPFELIVSAIAAAALAAGVLWLAVVTAAALLEAVVGLSSEAVRRISPTVLRRLVLTWCGVAIGGAATLTPVAALPHDAVDGSGHPAHKGVLEAMPLTGLALPDRVTGRPRDRRTDLLRPASPPQATLPTSLPTARPGAVRHLVRAGDSLWGIAERLLPQPASTAAVDAAWRRIYRENRGLLGSDPNLLTPGTRLRVPHALSSPPSPDGDVASNRSPRKDHS